MTNNVFLLCMLIMMCSVASAFLSHSGYGLVPGQSHHGN